MPAQVHVVQPGEVLSVIAQRHGTTVEVLLALNPQITDRDVIFVGQAITLPDASGPPGGGQPPGGAPGPGPAPAGHQHVVVANDTLSTIAARFGTTVEALMAANPTITDQDRIFVGQVITVPGAPGQDPGPVPGGLTMGITDPQAKRRDSRSGVGSAIVDWAVVPLEQRMVHVMELLVTTHGFPVNGAAGIVGNLVGESAVIPNRVEGSAAATPMRARPFGDGPARDWTAEEIMGRDEGSQRGPRLPGIGLAQWTLDSRRRAFFGHAFQERMLGAAIVFDMDAQVDFLVTEIRGMAPVDQVVRRSDVTLADATDSVTYDFERPGAVFGPGMTLLPRSDDRVQEVFRSRRRDAEQALQAFRNAHP
jgi:LysM repeat protein